MQRIRFEKGKQRIFLERVLEETGCPSLRALNQFGFDISYSTLKNYFSEKRNLPKDFFLDLCQLANIDRGKLDFEEVNENFGQVLGGKKSRK